MLHSCILTLSLASLDAQKRLLTIIHLYTHAIAATLADSLMNFISTQVDHLQLLSPDKEQQKP